MLHQILSVANLSRYETTKCPKRSTHCFAGRTRCGALCRGWCLLQRSRARFTFHGSSRHGTWDTIPWHGAPRYRCRPLGVLPFAKFRRYFYTTPRKEHLRAPFTFAEHQEPGKAD